MSTADAPADQQPGQAAGPDGGEGARGVKVRAHPGLCEGWGNCRRWASNVYPLDDDGHIAIHLLDVPAELAQEAWLGADACPAGQSP